MANNNEFLENILKKISVDDEREKQIADIIEKTMEKFGNQFPTYEGYRVKGSFKRSTNILGKFDVDINVFGAWREDMLLKSFYKKVKKFKSKNPEISFLRPPPYYYAIPISIHHDLEVDLLPAIKKDHGIYLIPEGYQKIIQTKPLIFEEKLMQINEKTNGISIKLIRLFKLWNYLNKKPFKSYQIERIVNKIFEKTTIKQLDEGLNLIFKNTRTIIETDVKIYDEINNQDILEGIKKEIIIPLLRQNEEYANEGQFSKIFPTI